MLLQFCDAKGNDAENDQGEADTDDSADEPEELTDGIRNYLHLVRSATVSEIATQLAASRVDVEAALYDIGAQRQGSHFHL